MTTSDLLRALVDDASALEQADLAARVRWLERVIEAVAANGRSQADERVDAVLTDLRAAIGAVVAWGRGPRTPESLVDLEVTMRALITRGTAGLYALVARDLEALAAHGVEADACTTAANAMRAAAEATARGTPLPHEHLEALAAVRSRLPLPT